MQELTERQKAIVSAIVLLSVNLASLFGMTLDGEKVLQIVCAIATVAATLWACYKNHNVSPEAAKAQEYLNELKAKRKGVDE